MLDVSSLSRDELLERLLVETNRASVLEGEVAKERAKREDIEAKFARLLDSWGIDYRWQFPLGPYVYDFLLPGRLLVEVHGGYYHADPRRYAPERLTPAQRRTVVHDSDKRHYAAERGYRLKVIWEHDLNRRQVTRSDLS